MVGPSRLCHVLRQASRVPHLLSLSLRTRSPRRHPRHPRHSPPLSLSLSLWSLGDDSGAARLAHSLPLSRPPRLQAPLSLSLSPRFLQISRVRRRNRLCEPRKERDESESKRVEGRLSCSLSRLFRPPVRRRNRRARRRRPVSPLSLSLSLDRQARLGCSAGLTSLASRSRPSLSLSTSSLSPLSPVVEQASFAEKDSLSESSPASSSPLSLPLS